MLNRTVSGLRKGLETVTGAWTRHSEKSIPVTDKSNVSGIRKEMGIQTDSIPTDSAEGKPTEPYPAFATAKEALSRLKDLKYSGVSSKLLELYRALRNMINTTIPDLPEMPDFAYSADPREFSMEVTNAIRLIHRDMAHAVMSKTRKAVHKDVDVQTEGDGIDLGVLLGLKEELHGQELENVKLRNDLMNVKITHESDLDQLEKAKARSYELEEKSARLDIELRGLKKKEVSFNVSLAEMRQQLKVAEENVSALHQSQVQMTGLLYTSDGRARKAEKTALKNEAVAAQAKVIQEINEEKIKLLTASVGKGANSIVGKLDDSMKTQLQRVNEEYEIKKAELKKRQRMMELQIGEQVNKLDAILDKANKAAIGKPGQKPIKTPSPTKIIQSKPIESDSDPEELEEEKPLSMDLKSKRQSPQKKVELWTPRDQAESEEFEEEKIDLIPVRSPTRSPMRMSTVVSYSASPQPKGGEKKPMEGLKTSFPGTTPSKTSPNDPQPVPSTTSVPIKAAVSASLSNGENSPNRDGELRDKGRPDVPESISVSLSDPIAAANAAEEMELLAQLSPDEKSVFFKLKAWFEQQNIWERAVRVGVFSKEVQVGEGTLPANLFDSYHSKATESASISKDPTVEEMKNWPRNLTPSPGGMSPRSKRKYQFAIWRALDGHSDSCGQMCEHLRRAMNVRRKVRGHLLPMKIVNVRYRKK